MRDDKGLKAEQYHTDHDRKSKLLTKILRA